MLDMFKENPFAILGIMVIIDIIGVVVYAFYALKKDRNTALKKLLIVAAVLIVVDGAYSIYVFKSNTFYDRNCESYSSMKSVVYYKTNGKAYKLDGEYFVSLDGTDMFTAEAAYVNEEGFLFYDKSGRIHKTELECIYKDDEGNKYYKATEVKWNSKGEAGIIIN